LSFFLQGSGDFRGDAFQVTNLRINRLTECNPPPKWSSGLSGSYSIPENNICTVAGLIALASFMPIRQIINELSVKPNGKKSSIDIVKAWINRL
jgi:hypothetical protein